MLSDAYEFDAFDQFGWDNFPQEYARVAEAGQYTSAKKSYLDDSNALHETTMLLIGRYRNRKSNVLGWARSDGCKVHFHHGRQIPPMPLKKGLESWIYYSEPFSNLSFLPKYQ